MTIEHDFDPDLGHQLEIRLAPYAPIDRIATPAARPARRKRIAATVLAATLAAGFIGLGYQINASADSQGLGCLHPVAKVQLYVADVASSLDHGGRSHDQQHDQRASHEACH